MTDPQSEHCLITDLKCTSHKVMASGVIVRSKTYPLYVSYGRKVGTVDRYTASGVKHGVRNLRFRWTAAS